MTYLSFPLLLVSGLQKDNVYVHTGFWLPPARRGLLGARSLSPSLPPPLPRMYLSMVRGLHDDGVIDELRATRQCHDGLVELHVGSRVMGTGPSKRCMDGWMVTPIITYDDITILYVATLIDMANVCI
jgi:hypothetical protein